MRGLLEEQRGVHECAARTAVALVDRQAVPPELRHPARDPIGVEVLVLVRDLRQALWREFPRAEVADRPDEVLLLVGQAEVGGALQRGVDHEAAAR